MKKTVIWLLVLSLLLGLAGCGSEPAEPSTADTQPTVTTQPPSTEPSLTEPTPTEPVTAPTVSEPAAPIPVTLKIVVDESEIDWLERRLTAFEAVYPKYDITWDLTVLGDWPKLTLVEYIRSDPQPEADIYLIHSAHFSFMMDEGLLGPIGKDAQRLLRDQVPQAAWDTVSFMNDETYGLPLGSSPMPVLLYRKSVFSPQDLVSMEALLQKGIVTFPFYEPVFASIFFYANGGSVCGPGSYDARYGIRFGGPEGQDTAGRIAELAAHPNMRPLASFQEFLDGSVDAFVDNAIRYQDALSVLGDDVGIAPLPTVTINGISKPLKAPIDFWMVCMGEKTQNKELATMLAVHLTSPDSQADRYTETGAIPIVRSLMDDPAIATDPFASATMAQVFGGSVPYRDIGKVSSYFWNKMRSMMMKILEEKLDALQAAALLDEVFPTPTALPETLPTAPPSEDAQLVTMRVWTYDKQWAQQMLDQFQLLHPEYEFQWLYEQTDASSILEMRELGMEIEPAVDVMMFSQSFLGQLIEQDILAPIRSSAPAGVSPILTKSVTGPDGNVYGLPISVGGGVLYYNKDIYSAEDLGRLEDLMKKGRVYYSLSTPDTAMALLLGNGCTVYGPDGNDLSAGIQLGGSQGYEVILRLVELMNDPAVGDDMFNRHYIGKETFLAGQAGAWIGGHGLYSELVAGLGYKLGVAPLPTIRVGSREFTIPALASPTCVGVGKYSRHPALAQELAAFLASSESQLLRYELHGSLPADVTLKTSPSISRYPHQVLAMERVAALEHFRPSLSGMTGIYSELAPFLLYIARGEVTKENYIERWDQFLREQASRSP